MFRPRKKRRLGPKSLEAVGAFYAPLTDESQDAPNAGLQAPRIDENAFYVPSQVEGQIRRSGRVFEVCPE